jgi:hypothetical protein
MNNLQRRRLIRALGHIVLAEQELTQLADELHNKDQAQNAIGTSTALAHQAAHDLSDAISESYPNQANIAARLASELDQEVPQ